MQSKSKNIELILPFLCKKCPVFNLILCIGIFVEQFIIFVKICTMNKNYILRLSNVVQNLKNCLLNNYVEL